MSEELWNFYSNRFIHNSDLTISIWPFCMENREKGKCNVQYCTTAIRTERVISGWSVYLDSLAMYLHFLQKSLLQLFYVHLFFLDFNLWYRIGTQHLSELPIVCPILQDGFMHLTQRDDTGSADLVWQSIFKFNLCQICKENDINWKTMNQSKLAVLTSKRVTSVIILCSGSDSFGARSKIDRKRPLFTQHRRHTFSTSIPPMFYRRKYNINFASNDVALRVNQITTKTSGKWRFVWQL